jgi:rod shape-determining protein MreC
MNQRLAKTYRKRRFFVVLGILFVVFFFLLQKGLLSKINPIISGISVPVWKAENFTTDFLSMTVKSKSNLYKQNILLKSKIETLQNDLIQTDVLQKENDSLKILLGRIKPEEKFVLSAILAKPNQTPYDTLIIDRGTDDGLKPDDLVFAGGNILVGSIESVEKKTSKVIMFSTPGNISQVIYGNTGKYFNAQGLGNGTIEVDVSRELEVSIGDMFFYPGLDGILIGVAKKVDFDPRDAFRTVIIKSPINIQEERWVEVKI